MAVYRLAASAEEDIVELLAYTEANFGEIARVRYERLLITALRDIAADPERPGSFARNELGGKVRSYHLRHSRERARTEHGIVLRPRHLLLYHVARADLIGVGRVLHDVMELERHLPASYGED
ncbi:Plasmid stabilization system protein [Mesorhizobium metallidurans STM 2683]|uniref:Plasmid stabilization system protein n=1 Tax=Mesorhizobium metallidurans STM 2683 TaxID=1297569 RepID=M5EK52_9HYPH|nr:type II toxin-antitoxin system RelE/ParE family toxin [Mesorhizobium metallidurans]CCV04478.1 Plasmid stabilization system protein [Mesorhizobium metallidurans STM 2683]